MDRSRLFARAKHLRITSLRLVDEIFAGDYRAVFKGLGVEFDHVREYVEQDDVRMIDWNVSSRMGSVYTKLFREEREIRLMMIVDMSASLQSVHGISRKRDMETLLFSLLTLAATNNNDRVGAMFFTDRVEQWVPVQKGRHHALRLLQHMITMKPRGTGSDLSMALRAVGETSPQRGICVILSDFKTDHYQHELAQLARRHDVIALRIRDAADDRFPPTGVLELIDPETEQTMVAVGRSRKFQRRYSQYRRQERDQWQQTCARLGVSALEIGAGDDPAISLIRFFKTRRR